MNLSQELWNLTKKILGNYNFTYTNQNNMNKIENTNKKFEELGMNTRVKINHNSVEKFYCIYDDKDASLFDMNFFYLFLKIYTLGDYIFYFDNNDYINMTNVFFERHKLPYIIKIKDNELKLYEVILKEVPLKL